MEHVNKMLEIDYSVLIPTLIISGCTILLAAKFLGGLLEWFFVDLFGIETKWGREKREEHDLLIATSDALNELIKKQNADMILSDEHDKNIEESLSSFIEESKIRNEQVKLSLSESIERIEKIVQDTQNQMKEVYSDNLSYRDKSRDIRDGMNKKIDQISESNAKRDEQIEAIMQGNMELLGDKIDQRYDKYISLGGIPINEVDEFEGIHIAYKKCKGNHGRDAKYKYVKENLPVIPVITKLEI